MTGDEDVFGSPGPSSPGEEGSSLDFGEPEIMRRVMRASDDSITGVYGTVNPAPLAHDDDGAFSEPELMYFSPDDGN